MDNIHRIVGRIKCYSINCGSFYLLFFFFYFSVFFICFFFNDTATTEIYTLSLHDALRSPRGFDAIANIVFHGTFYVTHSVGRRWIEAGLKGNIISILATWVWTGSPYVVPSAMSTSAINAMTKSLAVEWGPYSIRVNAIAPGPFPTEGAWARLSPKGDLDNDSSYSAIPLGRVGEMSELQNLASFLMADGCDYLTGQTIAIDGAQYITAEALFLGFQNSKIPIGKRLKV